jgi:phosphoglycerol transferase MdoB-like AlkP superfamily enzyme
MFERIFDTDLLKKLLSLVVKFYLFDLIWAMQTTFTGFSAIDTYVNAITISLLIILPYVILQNDHIYYCISLAIDLLLISNLMYNRTYNSVIPFTSYLHAWNLRDFLPSVKASLRIYDLMIPLTTLFPLIYKHHHREFHAKRLYSKLLIGFSAVSVVLLMFRGGLVKAIDNNLRNRNFYTCNAPMFTIFGCITYDLIKDKNSNNKAEFKEVKSWLIGHPHYIPLHSQISKPHNLILILCESLESWVLERNVEGKEITPVLNELIQDSTTLYAPKVLSQVKGGRSIDCQLMINAGLLPIHSGAFAFEYPQNEYKTLTKAMNINIGSKSILFTVDKETIWNQKAVASSFGFQKIYSRKDWNITEKVGPRNNLSDEMFFQQAVEKIHNDALWPIGESICMQFVTYSGHYPFKLPNSLRRINLKGNYPERLRDYITTANYTDNALGTLIKYLKSRKDFAETLIVIVGDHEGLASERRELRLSKAGKNLISSEQFIPLIIVNSPVGMRYDKVLGQIDIYPTLLQLLHLDSFSWKGLGQSILDKSKLPAAISPDMHVVGDTLGAKPTEIKRLQDAYNISDMIIRNDYLRFLNE